MVTRIKICGITDIATARAAVAAGADAVGLMFHPPSSRHLEIAQAAEIAGVVGLAGPWVASVAVMVNPAAEWVREMIKLVQPSCLQFHGDESADFCAGFGRPYIKGLRVKDGMDDADLAALAAKYASAQGILLDAHAPGKYGGSGKVFDWRRAGRLAETADRPLILAGGLTPDNVAEAVRQAAPYGVDVSSGVETAGRKDPEKIRRFCREIRRLDR